MTIQSIQVHTTMFIRRQKSSFVVLSLSRNNYWSLPLLPLQRTNTNPYIHNTEWEVLVGWCPLFFLVGPNHQTTAVGKRGRTTDAMLMFVASQPVVDLRCTTMMMMMMDNGSPAVVVVNVKSPVMSLTCVGSKVSNLSARYSHPIGMRAHDSAFFYAVFLCFNTMLFGDSFKGKFEKCVSFHFRNYHLIIGIADTWDWRESTASRSAPTHRRELDIIGW
jgi:hypothetical protein